MKVFPYVYKVTNKQTNEFYIGYREANKLNPEMDILIYKTSNKFIKNNYLKDFTQFMIINHLFSRFMNIIFLHKRFVIC